MEKELDVELPKSHTDVVSLKVFIVMKWLVHVKQNDKKFNHIQVFRN